MKSCQICGKIPARMAYGVLSCDPCKIFFRRNAQSNLNNHPCAFGTECDLISENQYMCKYCRLKKCFSTGMDKQLIRGKHSKKDNHSTTHISPTINIFNKNHSLLNTDQSLIVSNIIHSYDQSSSIIKIKETIIKQLNYPSKIRFKMAKQHIQTIINDIHSSIQLFIKTIPQFTNLSLNDQTNLLQRNIETITNLYGIYLLSQTNICQIPEYYDNAIDLYNSQTIDTIINHSDKDPVLFQLFIPVLIFSTSSDIVDPNKDNFVLENTLTILQIQNFYLEIIFKYFIYQYGFNQTISKIDKIIKTSLDQIISLQQINKS